MEYWLTVIQLVLPYLILSLFQWCSQPHRQRKEVLISNPQKYVMTEKEMYNEEEVVIERLIRHNALLKQIRQYSSDLEIPETSESESVESNTSSTS